MRVPHTILAAVTDGPPPSAYQRHLAHRIDAGHLDVTLHTTFSPGIRALLGHPALAGVIVPSRAEPFGRIPLEAYAAGASPVIATTAGGLAETVTEPLTGYTASPADPASLAAAIGRALAAEHRRPRPHARRRTPPHRHPPRLPRQRPGLPHPARPMGDQQPSVRITRRSRRINRQPPLPPGDPRRRPGLRDRRLTPAQDTRRRRQRRHQPPVDTAAIGIRRPRRELLDHPRHPHLRIPGTARTVHLLIPQVRRRPDPDLVLLERLPHQRRHQVPRLPALASRPGG